MNPRQVLAAARRRAILARAGLWLAPALALTTWLWRWQPLAAPIAAAFLLAGGALYAARGARRHDRAWLAHELDARCPELEDSAALALDDHRPAASLAGLQQARVRARLLRLTPPDLRPAWPRRRLALAWSLGILAAGAAWLPRDTEPPREFAAPAGIVAHIIATPPAYTGLGEFVTDRLDLQVPEGSELAWDLQLPRPADTVVLRFIGGSQLPLRAEGSGWRGRWTADRPTRYGIEADGAPLGDGRSFSIELRADAAPEIAVETPAKTLSLRAEAQADWLLAFVVRDDYGLGHVTLQLTQTKGGGENIELREQEVELGDAQGARERRYSHRIDLAALGFEEGDDLIARIVARDRRAPEPRESRSAAYILRWPAPVFGASEGLEGLVRGTLPAYFRSQRQIIIDSEALIAERASLAPPRFLDRSDTIGVDQKLLRLRYGQFLGEESDSGDPEHEESGGRGEDGAFGADQALLAEFGHTHDSAEAATLFDPATQRILRAALDEMWRAEEQLRLGQPEQALPYEYKALDYIKQVQQAGRIYLSRMGAERPQVDESRRLTGERDALPPPRIPLPPAELTASPFPDAWRALEAGATPPLDALAAWVSAHRDTVPDALPLLEDIERLRVEQDCAECRERMRQHLWSALPIPTAAVRVRLREPSP